MSQSRTSRLRPEPIVHVGHKSGVSSVSFSPDGKSIASGSWDNTICIWDVHSPSLVAKPSQDHTNHISSVAYAPSGTIMASGSWDKTIRLWDVRADCYQPSGKPLEGHTGRVNSIVFSPAENLIASASNDKTLRVWGVKKRSIGPQLAHPDAVYSAVFTSDSDQLISVCRDKLVRILSIGRGLKVVKLLKGHKGAVRSISISPDGSRIVTGSDDCTLRLWDVRRGKAIGEPYVGHTKTIKSIAFSPNGLHVASASYDGTVRIWDVRTGSQIEEPFVETDSVHSVAFSPCGSRIAAGITDGTLVIHNVSDLDLCVGGERHDRNLDPTSGSEEDERNYIGRHMSIHEMLDILSGHGCADVTSQLNGADDKMVLVSGGAFGDIWKGSLHSGSKVAVKTWRGSIIEHGEYKTLKRAAREIYFWSKMEHENVHQLMGVVIFKGQSFGMVSEWMDNGNLHEYLRKNPRSNRYQLSAQVGSGLAYVHDQKLVHGDIKGINVLISSDGIAKLTDFGLSIMAESSLKFSETTAANAGTIRWAAPELLIEGPGRSKSSDVYALGMTILEIFTGNIPYSKYRADFQVMRAVMEGEHPVRPTDYIQQNELGNLLWKLLLTCWGRNSEDRPSARAVVENLYLLLK